MNDLKKEAIEFCFNKFVSNRLLDIWLTIILTLGLAIIIFPILIWLIYRYSKAKKQVAFLISEMHNDPFFVEKIRATETVNSIIIEVHGSYMEIPQVYLWFSKYSKTKLVELLSDTN